MDSRVTARRRATGAAAPMVRKDQMLEVLRQFRIVLRAIKQNYQFVERRCGVSGAQLWALERIAARRGLAPGDLAHELAIHPSTASNLLARLEELKLVHRVRGEMDHRRVQLYLTARGQAVLAKAPRPLRGVLQQGLQQLPPASLTALQRRLKELIATMGLEEEEASSNLLSDW